MGMQKHAARPPASGAQASCQAGPQAPGMQGTKRVPSLPPGTYIPEERQAGRALVSGSNKQKEEQASRRRRMGQGSREAQGQS